MKNLFRLAAALFLITALIMLARHRMRHGDITEKAKPAIIKPTPNVQLTRRATATAKHGALLEPDVESISGEEVDRPMTPEEVDAQLELLP